MKTLVPAFCLLLAAPVALATEVGSAVSTDDICAVRPDLCGGAAIRHKKRKKKAKPAQEMDFADFDDSKAKPAAAKPATTQPQNSAAEPDPKKKKKKRTADSMADFWEREADLGEEVMPLDIERVERKPASTYRPAAVAPAPPRRQISFDAYLNANSNHSAVGGRYAGRQDAFQQAARPASLTGPAPAPASAPADGAASPSPGQGDGAGTGQSLREPTAPPAAPPPQ